MAYEKYVKQEFFDYPDANATILKAEHLEHIEDGLVAMEECVEQAQSDIETLQSQTQYSISAERFEEQQAIGLTVAGVRINISKKIVDSEGNISFEDYYTDVYDGSDGATVHGLSIYPFDPGNADLSGNVDIADVTITIPDDGRWLQAGDFLLTESGELYRVTMVTADLSMFAVEQFTTLGGSGSSASSLVIRTSEAFSSTNSHTVYSINCSLADIEAAYNAGTPIVFRHVYEDENETLDLPFIGVGGAGYYFGIEGVKLAKVIIMPETSGIYGEDVDAIAWVYAITSTAELPVGGTEGQVLTADADGKPVWADATGGSSLPTGGAAGQVLTIADDGSIVWADPTGGSGDGTSVTDAEEVEF